MAESSIVYLSYLLLSWKTENVLHWWEYKGRSN